MKEKKKKILFHFYFGVLASPNSLTLSGQSKTRVCCRKIHIGCSSSLLRSGFVGTLEKLGIGWCLFPDGMLN